MAAVRTDVDIGDFWIKFAKEKPKVVFKSLKDIAFYTNKMPEHLIDPSTKVFLKTAMKPIGEASKLFSVIDVLSNVNNLRKKLVSFNDGATSYLYNLSITTLDTAASVSDLTSWMVATEVMQLAPTTMAWLPLISGTSLTYTFGTKIVKEIFINDTSRLTQSQRNSRFYDLVKNVALFAIGLLLITASYIGFTTIAPYLAYLATTSLVCEAFKYYHDKHESFFAVP